MTYPSPGPLDLIFQRGHWEDWGDQLMLVLIQRSEAYVESWFCCSQMTGPFELSTAFTGVVGRTARV